MDIHTRQATISDIQDINRVLRSSKGHWGYTEEELDLFMKHLEITADTLQKSTIHLLLIDSALAGFYSFSFRQDNELELMYFFLHPRYIGKGIGSILWESCLHTAKEFHTDTFLIWVEPFAEGFYRKKGCQKVGEKPTLIRAGLISPIYKYTFKK